MHTGLVQQLIQPFVEEGRSSFFAVFRRRIFIADRRCLWLQDQSDILLLRERNSDRSHKDLITLVEGKALVREENSTSILSGQGDDIVLEHIEREILSEVLLEVQPEEVVSVLEEIPSMVKLDASQLGKFVVLIFGAENIPENCCRKDGRGRAKGTSGELVFISCDKAQDGRAESGH